MKKDNNFLSVSVPALASKDELIDGNAIRQLLIRRQVARIQSDRRGLVLRSGEKHRILERPSELRETN